MSDFYMLTHTEEIPVSDFPAPSKTCYEETLSAAEWLFDHTDSYIIKEDIVRFAVAYALELDPSISYSEVLQTLRYHIAHRPYKIVSEQFLLNLQPHIIRYAEHARRHPKITIYNKHIARALEQNYLRVSIGEPFRTFSSKDAYFLVSSTSFCWIEQIYRFVSSHQNEITSVTIARDPTQTTLDGYYFYYKGRKLDHLPVKDFLSVFETVTQADIDSLSAHTHRWYEGNSLR